MTDTTTKTSGFNLDAILGELEDKPLTYKGREFTLPAEFPAACLTPFLADDLGLIELIAEVLTDAGDDDDWTDVLASTLKKRATLPTQLIDAARDSFEALLDAEHEGQFAQFQALRPSITAYVLILRGIVSDYGVELTDFFGSDDSSESDGEPSKQTSPTTTQEAEKATSEASSDAPETPATSE